MGERAAATARLGLRATTLLVMGGIIGVGIFMNPSVVARAAASPGAVLAAWVLGGLVALAGGLVWAELAARRPGVGGQYAYLRDGIHPAAGFLYGWSNLLVVQSGAMAAVAVTFARYTHEVAALPFSPTASAIAALAALTLVNLAGVRWGAGVQSVFMIVKIVAIGAFVLAGLWLAPAVARGAAAPPASLRGFLAAMIVVLFAYGGWATATFVSGEIEQPARTLPRALLLGTSGVVLLYLGVNVACLRALGAVPLAGSQAPAADVLHLVIGPAAARIMAAVVAISALGFLALGMLAAPRLYYAMARDGLFFARVGRLHQRTGVPAFAIGLQGALAIATTFSGSYEEILSWVVTVDFAFLAVTAATLFVFRARGGEAPRIQTSGHPLTTLFFVVCALAVVAATFIEHPGRSLLGWSLIVAGVPVYLLWRRQETRST